MKEEYYDIYYFVKDVESGKEIPKRAKIIHNQAWLLLAHLLGSMESAEQFMALSKIFKDKVIMVRNNDFQEGFTELGSDEVLFEISYNGEG